MKSALGLLLLVVFTCNASAAVTGMYRIDSKFSHARFGVRVLWIHDVRGRFTQIAGLIRVGPQGMATVDARVWLDSAVMSSDRTRKQMLGPDFFDAAHYPEVHFISAPLPVQRLSDGGVIDGLLTLRGVTRRVELRLLPADCDRLAARACLIQLRGEVSRGEFGMRTHPATLSDKVSLGLVISLEPMDR